jgi:hypothetical protein
MHYKKTVILIILFLLFINFFIIINVNATIIYVESKTVDDNHMFTLNIYCNSTESIKGWELKLRYNKSLLFANSVASGTFFGSYSTFFSPGIINNEEGIISNIYELIIGKGNVSSAGVLVKIIFTALDVGIAFVDIYDVGIVNETQYLLKSTENGFITILNVFDDKTQIDNQKGSEPINEPLKEKKETYNIKNLTINELIIIVTIIVSTMLTIWFYIR